MEWWDTIRLSLQGFLAEHGVLAGFVLILIEEAGVPVPVPGDFLMLGLGVLLTKLEPVATDGSQGHPAP